MDIKLTQNTTTLWLNGSGITAGVKGARFSDDSLSEVDLVAEGTGAALVAVSGAVERLLIEAARVYGLPGEYPVRVVVMLPDGTGWQSPLKGGRIEAMGGPAARKLNSQTYKIHLQRDSFWESTGVTAATLTNLHGSGASATVYNHNDAAHNNFVSIAAGSILGDLPTPAIVGIFRVGGANTEVFVGQLVFVDGLNFQHQIEGEAGADGAGITSTHTVDASCSNGNYDALTWNGSAQMAAKNLSMNFTFATAAGGRVFRPIVRLRDLVTAGEKFWAFWRTSFDYGAGYEPIADADGILLPTDRRLVVFPSMYIPPWAVMDYSSDPVALNLMVTAAAAGGACAGCGFCSVSAHGWLAAFHPFGYKSGGLLYQL